MAADASPTVLTPRPRLTTNKDYSHVFRPPRHSPAATTPATTSNTPTDYFNTGSRKRSRADSSRGMCTFTTTEVQTPAWLSSAKTPEDDGAFGVLSTDSLVNDRYRLRGGFDTPGLLANNDLFSTHSPADVDINARRSLRDPTPQLRSTEPSFGALARERNGYGRPGYASSDNGNSTPSWTKLAFTLPFSIAGKVFSFGTTVLKGFVAGGGQAYEFEGRRWQSDLATPVPGSWYEPPPVEGDTSFEGDFEQDNTPTSRPPPNKRRLTDKDSWVMVGTPDIETAAPPSPKRKSSSNTTPRVITRPRASSRRSVVAMSRRHSYNSNIAQSPVVGTPVQSAASRASIATSPIRRSPTNSVTFPSPDAQRFARRQAKQERAADKTMNSMSRQLEELIRQGQAALGTKFTVEDNGLEEDEGFVDDEY